MTCSKLDLVALAVDSRTRVRFTVVVKTVDFFFTFPA